MSRVALLIEVSYCDGMFLPPRGRHLDDLRHALSQLQPRVQPLHFLRDPDLQSMQAAIRSFFRSMSPDDRFVLALNGYCVHEADGEFYFLTPQSVAGEHNTWLPVSDLISAMNQCPANQQVVLLDCHFWESRRSQDESGSWQALCEQFLAGRDDRVLLSAHLPVRPITVLEEADVWRSMLLLWTYSRYLAEGITTGAASANESGQLSAQELHQYAARQLQVAAPAVQVNLLGNPEVAARPFLGVPIAPIALRYRQVATEFAAEREVQATGFFPLAIRDELDRFRNIKQLEVDEAKAIEDQVLRPVQEALERMRHYREKRLEFERKYNLSPEQLEEELGPYLPALSLTRDRVGTIASPQAQARNQQYEERCDDFRQTVLRKLQGKSALEDPDLETLQRFQRGLQIHDADADTIILDCLQQTQLLPTAMPVATAAPPPPESEPAPSAADDTLIQTILSMTPEQRRMLERQLTLQRQDPSLSPARQHDIDQVLTILHNFPDESQTTVVVDAPEVAATEPSKAAEPEDIALPDRTDRRSATMTDSRRVERSAAAGAAPWIVGGMLAALLAGGGFAAFNFLRSQQQPDPITAGNLRSQGYIKAQEGDNRAAINLYNQAIQADRTNPATFINRGVSHHRLGDLNAALNDYNQALDLDPNSPVAFSNRSHVHYDLQQFQAAYNDANQAVQLASELPEAQINLGNARLKIAANPSDASIQNAAIQDYNQVINAVPLQPGKAAIALTNRGNILLAQGKNPEAFRDYDRAIQLNPEFAEAYFNRAIVSQRVNNIPAAIQDFERAAEFYDKQGQRQLSEQARQNANQLKERQQ